MNRPTKLFLTLTWLLLASILNGGLVSVGVGSGFSGTCPSLESIFLSFFSSPGILLLAAIVMPFSIVYFFATLIIGNLIIERKKHKLFLQLVTPTYLLLQIISFFPQISWILVHPLAFISILFTAVAPIALSLYVNEKKMEVPKIILCSIAFGLIIFIVHIGLSLPALYLGADKSCEIPAIFSSIKNNR